MKPFWYKLLECKANGATGLTLPFLIGVSNLPYVSQKLQISELILAVSANECADVMLKFCNETQEFVLTVSNTFILAQPYMKHFRFGKLLVVPEKNLKGLDSLDHIVTSFEIDYDKPLKQQEYSKTEKGWNKFSEKDLRFIQNCLKVSGTYGLKNITW